MVGLFDLLEDSAAAPTRLVVLPQNRVTSFGQVWQMAAAAGGWISARIDQGQGVATVLDTSTECIAFLLGALRAGHRVASLPLPPRGASLDSYENQVRSILDQIGAGVLAVDQRFAPMIPPMNVPVVAFQDAADSDGTPAAVDRSGGEFVQFTSGSTSDPKGVRLSVDQLAANVLAILERLSPEPGDGACSWLPLSHDMGLVGMLLSALGAGGRRYAGGGDVVLISPEFFLRDPAVWLETCTRYSSTFTATPDFGLGMVLSRLPRVDRLDLSRLRACVVGGEPVRATSLERFSATLAATGFRPSAFCPAYGLAEATLAVTMTDPSELWRELRLDPVALADGNVSPVEEGGSRLVAAGRALEGIDVSIASAQNDVGTISVEGPSVFEGYLGETRGNGPLVTDDLGFVRDRRLYVTGRKDDVLIVRGRKLFATDLEAAVEELAEVRSGSCVILQEASGYIAAFEQSGAEQSCERLVQRVRHALVDCCGIGPRRAVVVSKNSVPKTPSGKKRRRELETRLAQGGVQVLHDARLLAPAAVTDL